MSSSSKLQRFNTNQNNNQKSSSLFDPQKYATKSFPIQDVIKLKQCFDVFDYDKSGNVSPQELVTAIKALGLQHEAGKILKIVQSQTDTQQLDFQTFLGIFGFSGDINSQYSLRQLFQLFDKNSQGAFGVQQFTAVCQSVGQRFSQEEIRQMIAYADKDGDGKINFEEFIQIVTKQYPKI